MSDREAELTVQRPAIGDVPAQRHCLRCDAIFWSTGFGERICKKCKARSAWKSATLSPVGRSSRRSAK